MKTIDEVLKNKPLNLLDRFLRLFGRFLVIKCDLETREVSGWYIDKF